MFIKERDYTNFLIGEKKVENKNDDLKKLFHKLNEIFEYYIDDKPENYILYSLWTIGVQFHDQFITYPYLFLNAIKGSGKSRLLRLISIIGNGTLTSGITESGLFRNKGLLCLDESESLHSKEKQTLREIFNTAYKKGGIVIRMKKTKSKTEEKFVAEEFQTYRPIAMANIWGMESVLGDRCITCILEKSDNRKKTKLIENYEKEKKIIEVKKLIEKIKKENKSIFDEDLFQEWNDYITDNTKKSKYYNIFKKIDETEINGRNLELFFPLLIIASLIDEKVFDLTLEILDNITREKIEIDFFNNTDIRVYQFISDKEEKFYLLRDLFKEFLYEFDFAGDWTTIKWFSNELNKLGLVKSKRIYSGNLTQILINPKKAKEKIEMFKVRRKEEKK